MDVPFLSSSAINREHYNLVQSVESASTLQQVDNILVHKVEIVRRRFEQRQLTSVSCTRLFVALPRLSHSPQSECIPSLILLLYCWTATSLGQVTRAMLEFALPHAVTLAEAGSTLKAKRIGKD
jgi:AP-4 complex subunit epsilon-1